MGCRSSADISGTCIDQATAAPLQVKFRIKPPNPVYGVKYLAAKKPDIWGRRNADLDDLTKNKPVISLNLVGAAKDGGDLVKRG